MKFIYVAGPYTKGDPVLNTRAAIEVAETLAACGFVPFIPHLCHLWHLVAPHSIEFWYEWDMHWLSRCDALVRFPGESAGADREVVQAEAMGIPTFFSIEALLAAAKGAKHP